jgi:hypothetical protein
MEDVSDGFYDVGSVQSEAFRRKDSAIKARRKYVVTLAQHLGISQ